MQEKQESQESKASKREIVKDGPFRVMRQSYADHKIESDGTRNPVKRAGEGIYIGMNGLGAGLNGVCDSVGSALKQVKNASKEPLKFCRERYSTTENSVARKAFWGVAIAVTGLVRAVGGAVGIAGASVKAGGHMVHETCVLGGATARGLTRPLDLNSYKVFGSAMTRVGAELVMNVTAPVKQMGTELKGLGNDMKVPIFTQVLRSTGGMVQGISVMTEGATQGLRKMAVGDFAQGAKLIGKGIAAAAKTVWRDGASIAGDLRRDIKGDQRQDTKNESYSNSKDQEKNHDKAQDYKGFKEAIEQARQDGILSKMNEANAQKKEESKKPKDSATREVVGDATARLASESTTQRGTGRSSK